MTRGEVFRLRAPSRPRGNEQRGERFGVVVQASELLELSTVVVAPTSTSAQPTTFRPAVEIGGVPTLVLVEQMRAISPERLGTGCGVLSGAELAEVDRALRIVLGLAA